MDDKHDHYEMERKEDREANDCAAGQQHLQGNIAKTWSRKRANTWATRVSQPGSLWFSLSWTTTINYVVTGKNA
jgi:hypothetical protein